MGSSQFVSRTNMLLAAFIILICGAVVPETVTTEEFDISNVVFGDDNETDPNVCSEEYPLNINVSNITPFTVDISWKPLSNVSYITSYQIIYWEVITSVYNNVTVGMTNHFTVNGLKALTDYYIAVRGVCQDSQYSVASVKEDFLTKSSFPNNAPVITDVVLNNKTAVIQWSPLPNDQWNGIRINYIIVIADITSQIHYSYNASLNSNHSLLPDVLSSIIGDLKEDHTYIVTVSANSSGGIGIQSTPYLFKIEAPTDPPTNSSTAYVNYWYFLAVPAGIVLAILVTIIIVLCKANYERNKRNVQFVRDISMNIDDQKIIVSDGFSHRLDPTRRSFQSRPLPAYPPENHPHTPSVSSMNAHLIEQTSPNQFIIQRGMSFSTADQQLFHHSHPAGAPHPIHHHHHHPDVLPLDLIEPTHHQLRNRSVTSPQIPQLSQPLSDLSSATPSSVFTESNVPHQEDTASSPNTAKEYEVPSDSKTCHQSVSPVLSHTNTLPNPRRPHTASGGSQPVLSPHQHQHSPVLFTHSSSDVRMNHLVRAPDVPPHRSNSVVQQQHQVVKGMTHHHQNTDDTMTSPVYARPESGLYSEIPGDNLKFFPKITPPTDSMPRGGPPPMHMFNDGSVVSSDRYTDYSDIPSACDGTINNDMKRGHLPSVGEYRNDSRLSSDSMSSFSTDSQSSSPSHSKIDDHQLQHFNRIGSGRSEHNTIPEEHDYDEANSIITTTDNMSTVNSKIGRGNDLKVDSFKPNPYLSPVDLVSSINGHSPSD